jgi:hypothetical protein
MPQRDTEMTLAIAREPIGSLAAGPDPDSISREICREIAPRETLGCQRIMIYPEKPRGVTGYQRLGGQPGAVSSESGQLEAVTSQAVRNRTPEPGRRPRHGGSSLRVSSIRRPRLAPTAWQSVNLTI